MAAKTAVKKKPVATKPAAKKMPPKPKPKVATPAKVAAPTPEKSEPASGHNSGVNGVILRGIVKRIVNLEEEKRGISDDIKEIYAEAKAKGLAPKTIRKIVAIELADKEKLREEKELLDLYLFALDPELADVLS